MKVDDLVHTVPIVQTHIDRYLKWLPASAMLGSQAFGLAPTHAVSTRLALLGLSTLVMEAGTQGLKYGIDRARPALPLDNQSFPSSHTAVAAVGAEPLRRELAVSHPVLSYAGYLPVLLTGMLRLSKRRHWPSDVVAGAMVGVASVWLATAIWRSSRNVREGEDALRARRA